MNIFKLCMNTAAATGTPFCCCHKQVVPLLLLWSLKVV